MRARRFVLLASLALALPAAALAGDDPAARADDLAKRLLAPDPAVRDLAEREVAAAPADALRTLVRLLRDRALGPSRSVERDPVVGAEIPPRGTSPDGVTLGLEFDVRYVALEPDLAAKWLGPPTGASGTTLVAVPAANVGRLIGGHDGRPSRAVTRAGMGAFDGQYVMTQFANQTAYIADYDVRSSGGTHIADPIVASVSEGLHLGLRGRRRAEGGFHVEVDVRGGTVTKPIPAIEMTLGGVTAPVRIQVPAIAAFRSRSAIDVADCGSFLLGGLGQIPGSDRTLAALVSVYTLDFSKVPLELHASPSPRK